MAKKQLKKVNQPKKYLQGGSNMGSVAQMKQTPYYLGQVEANAEEEKFQSSQDQLAQARLDAAQAQKEAREAENQQLDAAVRNGAADLVKATATDQKAGRLGKLFSRTPLSGQAALNLSAGTQVAPMYAAPATTTVASNIGSLTPGAVEVGANLANTSTNVVSGVNAATAGVPTIAAPTGEFVTQGITAGAKGAAGMSALTSGLIGVAGNIAGTVIKNKTNDNSAYTATKNEATGNVVGSGVKSAATGFVLGNMILPGVGGAIGAGIGAGVGALKARKENKAAEEEAARLQREQAAVRGAYQSAFVNSRLTSADTGFGLNSSTNMNNNFTGQYQVARDGGVTGIQEDRRPKKVPGGTIVPIEGTDAVEFKGRSHEKGGIQVDSKTEVEGGETQDQVVMNNNNKQDYIFSKYLKLGGKSFAQRHKEILKGNGSQAEIQQLAAMQEKVAGRDSKQVAAYGGFHKYLEGGAKPCPECPPGTICDPATGNCVSDEDNGSNSYDWNATGLEGFKAKQNAAAPAATPAKQEPAKPTGPTASKADMNDAWKMYMANKKAEEIAAQNGTANAPADATPKVTYPPFGDPVENFRKNRDAQNAENSAKYGTYVDKSLVTANSTKTGKEALEAGMKESERYDKERAEKEAQLNGPAITDMASLEAAWSAGKITLGDYMAKIKEFEPAPSANTTTSNADNTNSVVQPTATAATNTETQPIDQEEQDWRNYWISQGYVFNAAGERELPPGKKLVVNDDGSEQIVDDTQSATGTATYTTPAGITPNGNKQSATQTDNTVAPDGTKLPAGYVWDATLNAPVSSAAMTASSTSKGGNAPNASQTVATAGVNTSTNTNTGTTTGPTVTYTNSKNPNDPTATKQTPEEIEAARLAGLPRLFMGASRKVDETTGNVTIDKGKPLMGVGAMAGSRLGTATGSQEDLAKVTRNSYDQAWTNKADNLYTNQKDASGGGLSSSDAIADRDKIAESNWGKKYGYSKGMSAEDAKKAHGKFAEDVHSLFKNNPDEMLGYFQYIIDGGVNNPKNPGTYLGKDAEQIRNNLTKKGFIGADGRPIAGKEKEMAAYLENQATNNAVGPIHNALGSFTAERGSTRIKLEEQKKKEIEKPVQELPEKFTECPPGTYRSTDGTCKPLGDVPQKSGMSGTMLAGLGQLIPVGAALMNPYKIAPGIAGAPAVKGSLMPRMNLNQERASAIQQNVAYKNAVLGQNAGPAALVAMQSANSKTDQQMMQIAKQEQDANRQLAAEEGKLGMQASMFNAENQLKTQMFNKEFNQKERQYRREDILGALDTGAARIAGIVKDDRNFKAQERLATALDETGSYDRFSILEQLNKEAKRKGSPYYGTTEAERRRMASAMYKELNPEGYVSKSEYTKLQEEKAKLQKEKEEAEKKNQAKFGGARQYVSRLGQLSGVRATKAKI